MSRILTQKLNVKKAISFKEFFSSQADATISPFLTPKSRKWGKNLQLRNSILSALLLLSAFVTSFFPKLDSLSMVLQVLVYFLVGTPALISAVREVVSLKINIDVLMVFAAFISIFIHSSLEGGLLLVLFSISSAMESFVKDKAKSTLNHLSDMMPTSAYIVTGDNKLKQRSTKDIQVDELILVRAGEVVPLDGEIIEGQSTLNVSHLTGEHIPIGVKEGHRVVAGAVNLEGSLKLKVTKTNAQSTIAKIIELICKAHDAKPKLQTWFDRFSQRYSIFVMASSFLFALLLPVIFPMIGYWSVEGSIYRALAYLIAASPCALIIAMPIAYVSAINACAKQGIILKGGVTLDTLSNIQAIAFDKTGTLTSGKLECLSITDINGQKIDQDFHHVIATARALEQHAIHPVAEAIVGYAKSQKIEPVDISSCRAYPGQGIEGQATFLDQKQQVAIGSLAYIAGKLSSESDQKKLLELQKDQTCVITALFIDQSVYLFTFIDHLKKEASAVLKDLKEDLNLSLYVLSGDNDQSVKRIAQSLSVDKYFGSLKPEDKLKLIEHYSQDGKLVMVGDGVNDAPALARASIGISMGSIGMHIANQVAEVILIKDDLTLIKKLLNKAKQTVSIVKQNVFFASTIIVSISILALFGWIPLWLAVVCHEGGTVIVGLNSLRLLRNSQ